MDVLRKVKSKISDRLFNLYGINSPPLGAGSSLKSAITSHCYLVRISMAQMMTTYFWPSNIAYTYTIRLAHNISTNQEKLIDYVDLLLKYNNDINTKDDYNGDSLLHYTAQEK